MLEWEVLIASASERPLSLQQLITVLGALHRLFRENIRNYNNVLATGAVMDTCANRARSTSTFYPKITLQRTGMPLNKGVNAWCSCLDQR